MKTEDGVFILECLRESDPGSEGQLLSNLFRIMRVKHQYIEVRTKYQFLALMKQSPFTTIHLTTHGSVSKKDAFLGLWAHDGTLTQKRFDLIKDRLQGITVVCTACKSGDEAFRKDFIQTTGCACFIAPKGSPKFHNSVFFSHILYHKHFVLKQSFEKAVKSYRSLYKNPHDFQIIKRETSIHK
ncbi:MAG: hypothetical protein ABSF91_01695 [Bacteroidota bacterium]|jgi:hypothetical protein